MSTKQTDERIEKLLKTVVEECDKEDRAIRERQILVWRRLKLFWAGFTQVWYSSTAHDWRIFEQSLNEDSNQSAYDKPVNVFRAYLESIIAALSVTVPPIKCYPDDADDPLDLATAKAGDKITELIYRHNDATLLWLHMLFIYCTEGMIACYGYPREDEAYGTYEKNDYRDEMEVHEQTVCSNCGFTLDDNVQNITDPQQMAAMQAAQMQQSEELENQEMDEFQPDDDDAELHAAINAEKEMCPACMQEMDPELKQESFIVSRLVGKTKEPKSRVCLEAYGGLYVKVPNYARKQEDCGYLQFSYECDYTAAVEKYEHLSGKRKEMLDNAKTSHGSYDSLEQWGRLSPEYRGEYPVNVVTVQNTWLRPSRFNCLNNQEDINFLKKKFPDGAKVVLVNKEYADACNESLDDCWTLTYNPLSDFIHFDPLGLLLASIQEITNDLNSLILQTIEHGIGLTFADPDVLNFKAFQTQEVMPGAVFPAKARSGKSLAEGFFEVKTATLSQEVLPFAQNIQGQAQLVSGALPSLFGGQLEGSETASQYSMSRAQALQRLQNTWKMLTTFWKTIFGKAIPMYIKEVKEDEKDVQRKPDGGFINVFIRKADLEGKIGKVELEANENLPMTWAQRRDLIKELLQANNPQLMQIIMAPENLPILREALGLDDLYIPGEDDVIKQYDEIKLLLNSTPMQNPEAGGDAAMGANPMPEVPSVEIDPINDNHQIQFEITRKWAISEAGRQAKTDNPEGYRNVLLHGHLHFMEVAKAQMQQAAEQANAEASNGNGAVPNKKPTRDQKQEAPIVGENNVPTVM